MRKERKIGVLFILIGCSISLITLPFLSGYAKDKGFIENLYRLGIELKKADKGTSAQVPGGAAGQAKDVSSGFAKLIPKRIPLRFFLAVTVILLYMGIVRVAAPGRQGEEEPDKEE